MANCKECSHYAVCLYMPTREECKYYEPVRPSGEWVEGVIGYHYCSECHNYALEDDDLADDDGKEVLSDFCPSCGASMVSPNSEIEKSNDEKTCLNCGTSEQECELGNRATHGFCGNWTERR